MNDNGDSSDGMDELHDIIAEYEAKEKRNKSEPARTKKTKNAKAEKVSKVKEQIDIKDVKKKAKRNHTKSDNGEVPMDKTLFGDKDALIKRLAKAVNATAPDEVKDEKNDEVTGERGKKRPAWTDADDEVLVVGDMESSKTLKHIRKDKTYKDVLTSKFTRLQTQPKWAASTAKRKSEHDSDDEELLRTVGFIAKPSGSALAPHDLKYKLLKDLNRASYSQANITSIEFHPTSTAALVADKLGAASIYAIDGRENEKLHTMFFKEFPITCARITPCGTKAIFGSVRHFYYVYDLLTAKEQFYVVRYAVGDLRRFELSPCGRYIGVVGYYGEMHLFHAQSNELLHTFKQEDNVASLCFTANSQQIICNSTSNTVSIFSLRQQRLEHSFIDDGCISGNVLDLSPNQRLFATGSNEGVVNVYDYDKVQKTKTPQPEKVFLNVTTQITDVKFNHSSELLGFCSNATNKAVRIAHFPSATVYANFPALHSGMGKVRSIHFSPNSGYLALGAFRKAALFKLKYFNNY